MLQTAWHGALDSHLRTALCSFALYCDPSHHKYWVNDHFSISLVVFNTLPTPYSNTGVQHALETMIWWTLLCTKHPASCSSPSLIHVRIVPCGGFRSTPEEILLFTFTMLVSRFNIAQCPVWTWIIAVQKHVSSVPSQLTYHYMHVPGKSVIDSFNIFQCRQLSWRE